MTLIDKYDDVIILYTTERARKPDGDERERGRGSETGKKLPLTCSILFIFYRYRH